MCVCCSYALWPQERGLKGRGGEEGMAEKKKERCKEDRQWEEAIEKEN